MYTIFEDETIVSVVNNLICFISISSLRADSDFDDIGRFTF